jgi:hypothetical protein
LLLDQLVLTPPRKVQGGKSGVASSTRGGGLTTTLRTTWGGGTATVSRR